MMQRSSIGALRETVPRAVLLLACAAMFHAGGRVDAQPGEDTSGDSVNVSRIIHTFDFNEPNTFDTIPRYWVRFPDSKIGDPSFPRYTEARFDHEVGHSDTHSFYLESKGQSVGYRYVGPDTRIRPGTYRIRGWIKTDQLRYGRAAISAYFLDWNGRYIGDTQEYSRLVGGEADGTGWQKVEIELTDVPASAQFVGVTCWLVQQDVWRMGKRPHRHIDHMDVMGGAWFDDIEIVEEPFADLKLDHPGNVIPADELAQVLVTVADDVVDGLQAELTIEDDAGKQLIAQRIPVRDFEERQATAVDVPLVQPGLYKARLTVRNGDHEVLNRTLRFAQLGASHHPPRQVSRKMGIIVEHLYPNQIDDALALFDALDAGIVKIPLWSGNPESPGIGPDSRALQKTMDLLLGLQVEVVGVFGGLPSEMVQSRDEHSLTLLDVLTDDPRGWREYLDEIVAPHANVFRSWQLGRDGDPSVIEDPRYGGALTALREGIRSMIAAPDLTAIRSAAVVPGGQRLDAENISVDLPEDIGAEHIASHLGEFIEDGRPRDGHDAVWVSVTSPRTDIYDPVDALALWSLRLLESRWSGVDVVFARQPWTTRRTPSGYVSEPTIAYLAYRTIADIVGDKIPAERLQLDASAQALTFVRGDQSVWVIWDPQAPPQGRPLSIQMGAGNEVVDLYGRQQPLAKLKDGRHRLVVTKSPVFVLGSERWLPSFRAGVTITPSRAEFALDAREFAISISNPHSVALSGSLDLDVPRGWDVDPPRFQFTLYPGETQQLAVSLRHPSNESAGLKQLTANIQLVSAGNYRLVVPVMLDLNLHDVDVWGYAVMDGDRMIVRHGMTSRADVPLSFRSFAIYPGRSRQYRVIYELLPGQTLATEYTFTKVVPSPGTVVRLGLREVNGPRIHNLQIDAP